MKRLREIIKDVHQPHIIGNGDVAVTSLVLDSRKATEGCLFFAVKGSQSDGHDYIDQGIQKGAAAIVCENLPAEQHPDICYIQVSDAPSAVGKISTAFYDYPSSHLKIVGITGTNGKTTVATLLFNLFTELGYKCGLLSTVQNHIGNTIVPATHTTPDAISLQHMLHQMVEAGCSHVFMEASSHAIHQQRIAGIDFTGAVFTNITHDHLDYHVTFDAYIKAKKMLFDNLSTQAFALTNADERRGMIMLQNAKATKKTYALKSNADFKGKVLENNLDGLQINIDHTDVHFRLSGLFNAYNILAVYGTAILLGEDKMQILSILSGLKGAPGRFETLRSPNEKILAIIDYAHTPDALLNVLATIKKFNTQHQVITVVGCGGDRDKTKRPVMAKVAAEHSTRVILTSDNPRSEDPEQILNDMESGLSLTGKRKTIRVTDRREAIKTACSFALKEDILLVAGKGHENYQEIKGIKYPFDDHEVLAEMFALLEK